MKTHAAFIAALMLIALCPLARAEKKKHAEHARSPMAAAVATRSGADFEAFYLGMMILHHKDGMPMWAIEREKGSNAELKAMEEKTTPKEQREIEQMTAWLKQWHGKTPGDFKEPEASMKKMEKDMATLKTVTGKIFDPVFGKLMADHHLGAIEMAKLAEQKAEHPEVKTAAKKIEDSQTADREKLLSLSKLP